jgi:hypothetical protein
MNRSPYPEEDDAMLENDVNGLAELDEDILTFDVPDDALERAAPVADRRIITLFCTKDPQANCRRRYPITSCRLGLQSVHYKRCHDSHHARKRPDKPTPHQRNAYKCRKVE